MGVFDTTINQFEVYNQPLNENPNSADLIGPALMAMKNEEDFMDHVMLTIIAILGRKDIHKFQNVIEDGRVQLSFPKTELNLLVTPSGVHESSVPAGAQITGVRIGEMRVMDWVNIYLREHAIYGYYPCIAIPTITVDDANDGVKDIRVIGAVLDDSGNYYNVFALDLGTDESGGDPIIVQLNYQVPIKPEGIYHVVYYSMGTEKIGDAEDSESATVEDENLSSVCVGITTPAERQEGTGGFVWKPISEATGNAVVLFPKGSPSGAATFNGETGRYRGLTNGGRPTTYFSKPGSEYVAGNVCSGTGGGGGTYSSDIRELCGIAYGKFDYPQMNFGEESGDLISFPPLPLRVNNKNYYDAFDDEKIHNIERLGNIVGVKTKRLIKSVMEDDNVASNIDKIEHVFLNFGSRIYDNSLANCRYLYLFFKQVREYMLEGGEGSFGVFPCVASIINDVPGSINPSVYKPTMCNVMSVEVDDYYYEFTFSGVTESTISVDDVMADENLREQYEDRIKTSGKLWYISSSDGDNSKDEDYKQPVDGAGNDPSEEMEAATISFMECDGSGSVKVITVVGFGGVVKIIDSDTDIVKMRFLNTADPNSIIVPYIPAIGEKLTNHELSDCFSAGLHVSLYVADIETKSLPWWAIALIVIAFIVLAYTGYGAYIAGEFASWIVSVMIGYILAGLIVGISSRFGVIAGAISTIIAIILTKNVASGSLIGFVDSVATMSLKEILMNIWTYLVDNFLQVANKVSSLITDSNISKSDTKYSALVQEQNDLMTELNDEISLLTEDAGGFVGIEPLLDSLIDSSIRTNVNPMDPSDYFSFVDSFTDIGTSLLDVDRIIEQQLNLGEMLQPI